MKKIIVLLFICLLIITGCGKKEEPQENKTSYKDEPLVENVCSYFYESTDNVYKVESKVTLYSRGGVVLSEKDRESVTYNDAQYINGYLEKIRKEYDRQNQRYGGTTFETSVVGNTATIDVTIDYSKYNMKNFMDDFSLDEDDMEDGFVKLETLKLLYEAMKFQCN